MNNTNLHIYQSSITKESRMFKISETLEKDNTFEKIILAGVQEKELPLVEQRSKSVYIRRAPTFGTSSRVLHYALYYFWLFYLIIQTRPKVLNIHSLELLPYAWFAKLFIRSKIIYDAHELETEKMGMSKKRKRISLKLEAFFITYCDEVIVVGNAIAEHYKKLYPKLEKPSVILNVPNRKDITKQNIFRETLDIDEGKLIYLYQGVLNKGRGIENLLDVFKNIENQCVIVFLGYGPMEHEINKAAEESPKTIYLHEAVAPDVVLNYTASADVGMCLIENKCLSYYYCLPNKLFEYAMAGLPIISTDGLETKRLINEYKIGYIIEEGNPSYLKELISSLDKTMINEMKANLGIFREKYNWENQEDLLISIYQNL